MASAEITPAPVNFAAAGHLYTVLAHMAAATLAARAKHSLVVNADNIAALDEAVFPIPVGRCRFIVVGKRAFDLLPERTQQFVFDPPQPDQSDYFGAVGQDREETHFIGEVAETENKLFDILQLLDPPKGISKAFRQGAGDDFRQELRVLRESGGHFFAR